MPRHTGHGVNYLAACKLADLKMKILEMGHQPQTVPTSRQRVAGCYRLLARIGSGRLGDIFEAIDEGHHDLGVEYRVAVQLMPDKVRQNQGLFNKLKLGYTVLRANPHPNIVRTLDFDDDDNHGVSRRGIAAFHPG
jgi:serine/threonine protein kinase